MTFMGLDIRPCGTNELSAVIERLDQEFVFGKTRSLSLSTRFPNALSLENIEQIRVASLSGQICGACVIKIFEWAEEKRIWQGAMIGMVWVDPRLRGRAIGTTLIKDAMRFLREKKVDFGVLWTGTQMFYERAGWFPHDQGIFGQMTKRLAAPPVAGKVVCRAISSADAVWLEALRSQHDQRRVLRTEIDYRKVPIPAAGVLCFSAQADDGSEGFALVGEQDHTGYLYEMVGSSVLWEVIWSAVNVQFDIVYVNGRSDDPFAQWLSDHGYVSWQSQHKAMWFIASTCIEPAVIEKWHIPFFDWI
jgi:predicted N-acetyltransferase YhbS